MLTYVSIFATVYAFLFIYLPLFSEVHHIQYYYNLCLIIRHVVITYITWHTTNFIWRQKWVPKMRLPVANHAILVTGCDTGFGNLLARKLDKCGFKVFACCLFPQGEGAKTLIRDCSNRLTVIKMDVTSDDDVNEAVKKVESELRNHKLLAVVNNAGVLAVGEVEFGSTIEPFERQMNINCLGVIRVTKAFCPLLRRCKNSRLVNVTSLAARISLPGLVGYCVSKCAALSFTDGIRIELMKWGIKTISIEPHLFKTNLIGQEAQHRMLQNLWENSRESTRKDYGENFFEGAKRLLNTGTDTARTNINDVVQAMYDSITIRFPETHKKVCSSEFERIRVWFLIYVVPRAVQDFLLHITTGFVTGKPSMLTKNKGSDELKGQPCEAKPKAC